MALFCYALESIIKSTPKDESLLIPVIVPNHWFSLSPIRIVNHPFLCEF